MLPDETLLSMTHLRPNGRVNNSDDGEPIFFQKDLPSTSPNLDQRRTAKIFEPHCERIIVLKVKIFNSQSGEESFFQCYHQIVNRTEMHLEKKF